MCSDSCSNSHARFQRADVFTGASHAYFPQGDAFRCRPELELKWPFTRNTSWETAGAEWQNTPWPDADAEWCVCVCVCICVCVRLYLTVVAKLSESCDNWSQMFESPCVVILLTCQTPGCVRKPSPAEWTKRSMKASKQEDSFSFISQTNDGADLEPV